MYVTNETDPVFCIHGLPEEVIAVLFAYVSRNPKPIRDNLQEILINDGLRLSDGGKEDTYFSAAERAKKFHEKWVVGYGHASVAEHAVLHFGIEEISILATKVLEDARLAAYTEKSTRYQFFDAGSVYLPKPLESFRPAMDRLMIDYRDMYETVYGLIQEKYPPKTGIDPKAYDAATKALTCDLVRGLLPAGTKTMLGMTVNAREAAYITSKLLSHPLQECQDLGEALKREGSKLCPTLFRHAERSETLAWYENPTNNPYEAVWQSGLAPRDHVTENGVSLVSSYPDREASEFLARILTWERSTRPVSMKVCDRFPLNPDWSKRYAGMVHAEQYLSPVQAWMTKDDHQAPPRAFEFINFTFEIVVDYGAFRDIQRHRIGTQISPLFTDEDGFEIPDEIRDLGLTKPYVEAILRAQETYKKAQKKLVTQAHAEALWIPVSETLHPLDLQYLLPMAFRKRLLVQWNLREVIHFIRLRSGAQGHPSYRKLAWQMRRLVLNKYPTLEPFMKTDLNEYPLGRLAQYTEA